MKTKCEYSGTLFIISRTYFSVFRGPHLPLDTPLSVEYSKTQLSDEVTHRIATRTVSGRDHETMTHVPRDTHVTKQRMAMRSNFPWSDFKKLGTPELSSSSSTSTALSPKNFEKRAHPKVRVRVRH